MKREAQLMYKKGIFIAECKNRFRSLIEIDGKVEPCFICSSSKLSPLITLINKEVIVRLVAGKKAKVKYALFGVRAGTGYTLLDLNYVNALLYEKIANLKKYKAKAWTCKRERKVLGKVKTDLLVEKGQQKIVYEAKAIIAKGKTAVFPSVEGERALRQLKEFKFLLKKGIEVNYCLFLLTGGIKTVGINKENKAFVKAFKQGLKAGMQVKIYEVVWKEETFRVKEKKKLEKAFQEQQGK
jgi:DNA-binding sugar fermentation-stimulating protein